MLQVIKALKKCVFPEIKKDISVDYLSPDGKRHRYSYASLPNVLNAVTPELKKNGLIISQLTAGNGITTYLFHESGEYIFEKSCPEITYANIQEWGASITYQRRYAILSMLGLVAEDDHDGKLYKDVHEVKPKLDVEPSEVKPELDENLIGGRPRLDDATYKTLVKAIEQGNFKLVDQYAKKYSPTFTQIDELNKLMNEKKVKSLKQSIK